MQKNKPINRVDRSKAVLKHNFEEDDFVDASPAECLSFMWELTKEVWSLSGSKDAERRLQRHIATLHRKRS
ncbi:MAG: hypothetical protein BWY69_00302 [Planctomycetes bacterium ADurb.Bin401]|nr:MAG: hypothetical protein BWY69_00302 [Planctomycetes bacterium ADurb.Bin401]